MAQPPQVAAGIPVPRVGVNPSASAAPGQVEEHSARLGRTDALVIGGFWTFIALLSAANVLLDPRGPRGGPGSAGGGVAMAVLEAALWAAVTPVVFWMAARFPVERANWPQRTLLYAAAALVTAMLVETALGNLRFWIEPRPLLPGGGRPPGPPGPGGPGGGFRGGPLPGVTHLWWLNEFLTFTAVLAAGIARDYFIRFRARHDEAVRLRAQAAEAHAHSARLQAQLAEARLATLRTQLDPHFLFNTLNAVSALVERDPDGVQRMIARLSELLRFTLEGARREEVTVAEEIGLLRRYLDIMQVRFGGRLRTEMDVDHTVHDARVPTLILQPLAENAIRHGVGARTGAGVIRVSVRREGGELHLSVRDDGGTTAEGPVREGVGLRNTRERLEQMFGPAQRLRVGPVEGGWASEIVIPYRPAAETERMEPDGD